MRFRGAVVAALVAAARGDDDATPAEAAAAQERQERRPPAGDYAAHRCTAHNPRTEKINRACEQFALLWDVVHHDLEDVCDGPCPDAITSALPYFEDYKIASLGHDAELYGLEAELAALYRDAPAAARLRRLAAVSSATQKYERTGDGAKLEALLAGAGAECVRDFMKAPKALRTTALFEAAQADGVTVMEALRREIDARARKRKRRRKRRKQQQAEAAPL